MKLAGIDPIIAILVGVGWFIVKALLNRRQDADAWEELERPAAPPPHVPQRNQGTVPPRIEKPGPHGLPPPVILIPPRRQTALPPPPPPIIHTVGGSPRPVIYVEPEERGGPARPDLAHLKQSEGSHARASHLQESIAKRFSAINQQTEAHKPTAPKIRTRSATAANVLHTFRNPLTVRQAFLASFVLNPPKALE